MDLALSQAMHKHNVFALPPLHLACSQCSQPLDLMTLVDGRYALGHMCCVETVIISSMSLREVMDTFRERGGNANKDIVVPNEQACSHDKDYGVDTWFGFTNLSADGVEGN